MKPQKKTKWSCRWEPCEIEAIGKIADSIHRTQNASDLSRWRAAEAFYRNEYGYLRARRPKR